MSALDIFRARMVEEMHKQGLTQQALADKIGVHRQSLAKVLIADRGVNLAYAERIAHGLGLELSDLLTAEPRRKKT